MPVPRQRRRYPAALVLHYIDDPEAAFQALVDFAGSVDTTRTTG
ncbi:hypothetical protein [Streptomyces violascens]